VEDHDAVAGTVRAYALADGGDYAGGFVAEDARGGVGAGGDFLEVGAAHTAGVDTNEYFSGADGGDRDSFEADVVLAAVHSGLHGCGDRLRMAFDRDRSGTGHNSF